MKLVNLLGLLLACSSVAWAGRKPVNVTVRGAGVDSHNGGVAATTCNVYGGCTTVAGPYTAQVVTLGASIALAPADSDTGKFVHLTCVTGGWSRCGTLEEGKYHGFVDGNTVWIRPRSSTGHPWS